MDESGCFIVMAVVCMILGTAIGFPVGCQHARTKEFKSEELLEPVRIDIMYSNDEGVDTIYYYKTDYYKMDR